MMAKTFKNSSSAMAHMNAKLKSIVESSVREVINNNIIPTMLKNIDRVVYDVYTPQGQNPYQRRDVSGGLIDPDNIKFDISFSENVVKVHIRNVAEVAGNKFADNGYKYKLDELIINGDANWKNSVWYGVRTPRDFYEATINEMQGELPLLLARAFKKRGLNVKFKVYFI